MGEGGGVVAADVVGITHVDSAFYLIDDALHMYRRHAGAVVLVHG